MKIFILMIAASATDGDCERAQPLWAIESEAECAIVAEVLNRNSDEAYAFCVEGV